MVHNREMVKLISNVTLDRCGVTMTHALCGNVHVHVPSLKARDLCDSALCLDGEVSLCMSDKAL